MSNLITFSRFFYTSSHAHEAATFVESLRAICIGVMSRNGARQSRRYWGVKNPCFKAVATGPFHLHIHGSVDDVYSGQRSTKGGKCKKVKVEKVERYMGQRFLWNGLLAKKTRTVCLEMLQLYAQNADACDWARLQETLLVGLQVSPPFNSLFLIFNSKGLGSTHSWEAIPNAQPCGHRMQ